jgi:hypothetical protein
MGKIPDTRKALWEPPKCTTEGDDGSPGEIHVSFIMITKRLTKVENEAQLKRDQRLKSVPHLYIACILNALFRNI